MCSISTSSASPQDIFFPITLLSCTDGYSSGLCLHPSFSSLSTPSLHELIHPHGFTPHLSTDNSKTYIQPRLLLYLLCAISTWMSAIIKITRSKWRLASTHQICPQHSFSHPGKWHQHLPIAQPENCKSFLIPCSLHFDIYSFTKHYPFISKICFQYVHFCPVSSLHPLSSYCYLALGLLQQPCLLQCILQVSARLMGESVPVITPHSLLRTLSGFPLHIK